MKQRCWGMSSDNRLTELPLDSLQERLAAGDGPVWVDVEDPASTELGAWLESLAISPGAVRALAEAKGRTQVRVFNREVFFELPTLASDAGSERVMVAFVCTKNLCITIHRKPVAALAKAADALTREMELSEPSTAQLTSTILLGLSEPVIDEVLDIRSRVLKLQDQMERDPDGIKLDEILDYGSAIRSLDAITTEHVICFGKLRLLESTVLDISSNSAFQAVASDAQYLDRVALRLEKDLTTLHDQYGMNQQDRTNQRLAFLTVISAIFLPMTLIASIEGMNFAVMPLREHPYSYPAILLLMAITAVGMIWYFRFRGWFK